MRGVWLLAALLGLVGIALLVPALPEMLAWWMLLCVATGVCAAKALTR